MAGSTLGGGMQGATQGSGLMGALSGGGGGALMNNVGSLGSSFSSSSQPQAPGIQLTDPLKNIKLANTSGRYSYE